MRILKKYFFLTSSVLCIGLVFGLVFYMRHKKAASISDEPYHETALMAITNSRLGDNLSLIYTSIYLSQKYTIPFMYYQPFQGAESLYLSIQKKQAEALLEKRFKKVKRIFKESDINLQERNVLYKVGHGFIKNPLTSDQLLRLKQEFSTLIKPLSPMLPEKPKKKADTITVALHVRKGGGFDRALLSKDGLDSTDNKISPVPTSGYPFDASQRAEYWMNNFWHRLFSKFFFRYEDVRYPYKFPPDSFFVEQLQKIAAIFPTNEIATHIFTDDKNPAALAEKYSRALHNPRISFTYREHDNSYNRNVLDDFFAMTTFDCLIRPASAYSVNVQRLGNFKIVISPAHGTWVAKDRLIIDAVTIEGNAITNIHPTPDPSLLSATSDRQQPKSPNIILPDPA